jgi:hypothetical protein
MSASPSPDQDYSNLPHLPPLSERTEIKHVGVLMLNKRTFRFTLSLGIIAGLAFSLSLWGYEAILFFQAHVAYPWMPFIIGTLLSVLLCTLAALLTWLVNRALFGIVFWVLTAWLLSQLTVYIPLKIAPALMKFLEPALSSRLPIYPINDTLRTWIGIGTVWLSISLGILGLLQLTFVDQSVSATSVAGRLAAYFIFVPVMALASVLSSNMINEQLRAPLIGTDKVIRLVIKDQAGKVDPVLVQTMHLKSFDPITPLIDRPRRLFLGKYNDYYDQVDVLVDFQGEWTYCNTVNGQPVFCGYTSNP